MEQAFDGSDLASHQQQMAMGSRSLQQPYQIGQHGSSLGLGTLPPQTPIPMTPLPTSNISQFRPIGIVNVPTSNMNMANSTQTVNAAHPLLQQPQAYVMPMNAVPTQQLPPTPKMEHRPVQPLPGNGLPYQMSSESLINRPTTPTGNVSGVWQQPQSSAQQRLISSASSKNVQHSPQSEHTSGRGTNESSSDSSHGGMGRATPPPLKPMGIPKSNVKLVPGRMVSSSGKNISSTAV